MKMMAFAAAVLVLAVMPAAAQKPYEGVATGNLMVDGKPVPLKFAYVVDVDNVEEAGLLTATRHAIILVLSDRALPRLSVSDRDAPFSDRVSPMQVMMPMSKTVADSMYGIVLKIDPDKANPVRAQFLFPGSDKLIFIVSGTEFPDRVTGIKREGGFLSATASVPVAQATGLRKGPRKYQYKISFRAPIIREAAVTENLEGPAALASAPVAVLKSYVIAGKKGDIIAIRKLTAKTHLSYLTNKDFLDSLKGDEGPKLLEQIKRVVIRGDSAAVVIVSEEPNYSHYMMHLIRENGDWKMCWP